MEYANELYQRFIQNGDTVALTALVAEYRDGLILYLNSLVGDLHTAEDLAEETFAVLLTKKPRHNQSAGFKTWLYTIGRRLAFNHLRYQKRHPDQSLEDVPTLQNGQNTPDGLLALKERSQSLHRGLLALPTQYRQVLWLIYFEQFSMKQSATILHKTVHATETLAYRARNALRQWFEQEGLQYENL